ncbi:hypothetical protein ACU5AY_18030 [Rhizobium sp. PAMB 3174]
MKINMVIMSSEIRISHMQNNDICLSRLECGPRRKATLLRWPDLPLLTLAGSILFVCALTAGFIS